MEPISKFPGLLPISLSLCLDLALPLWQHRMRDWTDAELRTAMVDGGLVLAESGDALEWADGKGLHSTSEAFNAVARAGAAARILGARGSCRSL